MVAKKKPAKKPAKFVPPWLKKDDKDMPMDEKEMPAKKDKKGGKHPPMKEKCK